MRRIIAIILGILCLFQLAACGNSTKTTQMSVSTYEEHNQPSENEEDSDEELKLEDFIDNPEKQEEWIDSHDVPQNIEKETNELSDDELDLEDCIDDPELMERWMETHDVSKYIEEKTDESQDDEIFLEDCIDNPELFEKWLDSHDVSNYEVDISRLDIDELEDFKDYPEIIEEWLDCHDVFDFMEWETVKSSAIKEVGYASWPFEALGIRFVRNSDPVYVYYQVPASVYYELINADSIGGYYNSEIKGKYDCEKIE